MSIPHIPEYQDPRILDLLERIEALEAVAAEYKMAIHSFSEATKKLLEAEIAEAKSKIAYPEPKDYPDPPYLVN